MKNLCVGNTWDLNLLDQIDLLNRAATEDVRVTEVFGSLAQIAPSVRSSKRLPKTTLDDAAVFISKARDYNIDLLWTVNQMLDRPLQDFADHWEDTLKPAINTLSDMGIWRFVVANPLLLKLIRKELPLAYLEISTVAGVNTVKMLEEWRLLGANGVCPSLDMNRDLDGLRSLNRTCEQNDLRLKLLATEACLLSCPHRHTTCYLSQSTGSKVSKDLFEGYPYWCNDRRVEDPSQWLKAPLILPQWLDEYERITGATWFKITGRTHPTSTVLAIAERYMKKDWGGNLLDLAPGYAHLTGGENPALYIDTRGWAATNPPFLRDPRFRCLDRCGTLCNHCDHAFKVVGRVGAQS